MTFLYFAYGSNLLAQRIHLNNPSAKRIGIGKLNGYRLDFNGPVSKFWKGCPATVVPDDDYVWGAVWQMNVSDLEHLDNQEGVSQKIYLPIEANVTIPNDQTSVCRSYMLVNQPDKQPVLPPERRPSIAYLETILLGAQESGLPLDYVNNLKLIPHNNVSGPKMPWSNHRNDIEL